MICVNLVWKTLTKTNVENNCLDFIPEYKFCILNVLVWVTPTDKEHRRTQ